MKLTQAVVRRDGCPVLDHVSVAVAAGEIVGVVGPNGAGKTTLIRAALGLARLDAGRAELGGDDVARLSDPERARRAGYMPQDRHIGWNMSAWRIASLGAGRQPPAIARRTALEALARVGLADLAERGVLEMSGGERARVLLARLLATGAPLLVTDEPAAGLDPDAQILALDLLREEAARGAAVMLTLHDLTLAARTCDRLVVIARGRIVADAPPAQALTSAVLAQAFGLDGHMEQTSGGPALVARRLEAKGRGRE
ncbi:MAG: ABC transporter ATP-binding protein [Phenylobacterium sp.]|nr:ABC transporter ATP-binding protein [Phenylobacterium sp.]